MDENKSFKNPPQSYWISSTTTPNYKPLDQDTKSDVVIVGGGIAGISCGYMLINQGVNVIILEANTILHGTTGHTTAKITSQHGLIYHKIKTQMGEELAKQYADANESAIKLIEKISKDLNVDCDYISQPAYVYTQQDKYVQQIMDEVETAKTLGINASYQEKIPFDIQIKGAVRFDNQAQFHPLKYLIAMANEFVKKGGKIYENTTIIDLDEGDNYTLTTKDGKKIIADKVIIASHYPFYNKSKGYFSRIFPERSYVLGIKASEKYPGGMYITAEDPARSLRHQNTEEGELILVGGEHHQTGQGEDTITHYEALRAFANQVFTVEDIPYRWSTQDCVTVDGVPYVGHFTSNTPNLYIATGYGKWGMTNSAVTSMILSDLIIKDESQYADVYNPSRHTIMASAKKFVTENLDVAKNLIGGKVSSVPEIVTIKRGEAQVINVDGQKTGAYRDEQGTLHFVNTTCTHMGCELNWNSAEKSWDCPCHGSRFTWDGMVIEGPTVKPLTQDRDVNTINKLISEEY